MGAVIAFVFGLIVGSFLNVVILRFDDWLSIIRGSSQCPNCKTKLTWYDLIPVFSYLSLKGKCRYCAKPISWQYPVVELSMAALSAAGFYQFIELSSWPLWQSIISLVLFLLAASLILVIFFHDLYEMMIPDLFSNLLLGVALVFSLIYYRDALGTLLAGLTGFLPIALLVYPSKGKWMGEGDIKLSAALGLLAGWPAAAAFIVLAFLSGGIFGAGAVTTKKAGLKSAIPFAPFLIFGGLIAIFFGLKLVNWYLGTIGYGYY